MKTTTSAMKEVGKAMKTEKMPQTLQEFLKENEKMEMSQGMMDDALDSVFDADGVESETDEVMNQIYDEIGLDLSSELSKSSVPTTVKASSKTKNAQETKEEDELLKSLGIFN